MTVQNHRDLLLKLKLMIPERVYRVATLPVAAGLRMLPDRFKYERGIKTRKARFPYAVIGEGSVVMQIGAPSDLLSVGRSRAGYFLHMVGPNGKVVVLEPDEINCDALQAFADRNGLSDRLVLVRKGGWNIEKVLHFYQSRKHPASAVLVELSEASPEEMERRGYRVMDVPVTTVDAVYEEHNLPVPRLISITTNGAELQILEGMAETFKTGPEFISLAITGDGYVETMPSYGYEHHADDDRGFTFRRSAS